MRKSILPACIFLLVGTALGQSDFKLTTERMPKLSEALIPLPEPLGDTMVRASLESYKIKSPNPEETLKQTVNDLKTRQFSQALPRLEYLQGIRPTEPDLLILRGCVYAESGHPEVAEKLFQRAILIAPSHPWARLNLAEAYLTQKKLPEAEATLGVLAATRPESEVVRFKLVLVLTLEKKYAATESEIQYLEEHASTPAYYFAKAAVAFGQGNSKQGNDFLDQARTKYGEAQTAYFHESLAAQGWVAKQN